MFRTTVLRAALLATALPLVWLASSLHAASQAPQLSGLYGFESTITPLSPEQYLADIYITDLGSQVVVSSLHMLVRANQEARFEGPDGHNLGLAIVTSILVRPESESARIEVTVARGTRVAAYRTSMRLTGSPKNDREF